MRGDDVGVVQPLEDRGLSAEPEHGLGVLRGRGGQQLEGDLRPPLAKLRLEHHAHPARAELAEHDVRPDQQGLSLPLEERRGLVTGQLAEADEGPGQPFGVGPSPVGPGLGLSLGLDGPEPFEVEEPAIEQRPLELLEADPKDPAPACLVSGQGHRLERLRPWRPGGVSVGQGEPIGLVVGRHDGHPRQVGRILKGGCPARSRTNSTLRTNGPPFARDDRRWGEFSTNRRVEDGGL